MLLEVPAHNAGWKPMRRQDRGDVGGRISLQVFWRPAACCQQCVAVIRCFAASFWLPVFGVRYIEEVYLHNSMILELSTASLRSVCSSQHEAGQRSFWFEICISLGGMFSRHA